MASPFPWLHCTWMASHPGLHSVYSCYDGEHLSSPSVELSSWFLFLQSTYLVCSRIDEHLHLLFQRMETQCCRTLQYHLQGEQLWNSGTILEFTCNAWTSLQMRTTSRYIVFLDPSHFHSLALLKLSNVLFTMAITLIAVMSSST